MDILIVGIHTRPAVFSAKELGYNVYSVDYFGDIDLKEKADFSRSIVDQQPFKSMGRISENYSDEKLIELAKGVDSDLTVLTSTLEFNNGRVIGTPPKKMKKIKDKAYQLRKVQKTGVRIPKSYTGDLRRVSCDIPCKHAIIEEGEPISTAITHSKSRNEAIKRAKEKVGLVYRDFIANFNQEK